MDVLIWPAAFLALNVVAVLYLIPTIVAYNRNHKHRFAIMWLNILLGGSGIAWVAALVWACMEQRS